MSSDLPKLHPLPGLTKLAVVYLRNAVNNPKWAKGIADYIAGANVIGKLPDLYVPKDLTSDVDVLKWGNDTITPDISFTDKERDAARVAFRAAIDDKHVAINKHSVLLITLLGLE